MREVLYVVNPTIVLCVSLLSVSSHVVFFFRSTRHTFPGASIDLPPALRPSARDKARILFHSIFMKILDSINGDCEVIDYVDVEVKGKIK